MRKRWQPFGKQHGRHSVHVIHEQFQFQVFRSSLEVPHEKFQFGGEGELWGDFMSLNPKLKFSMKSSSSRGWETGFRLKSQPSLPPPISIQGQNRDSWQEISPAS